MPMRRIKKYSNKSPHMSAEKHDISSSSANTIPSIPFAVPHWKLAYRLFGDCGLRMARVVNRPTTTGGSSIECTWMIMVSNRVIILLGFASAPLSAIERRRGVERIGTRSTERRWRLMIIGKLLRWGGRNPCTFEPSLVLGWKSVVGRIGTAHIVRVWHGVSPAC